MRNKALIFTVLGCIGVVSTTLLAIHESMKVCEYLDKKAEEEEKESLPKKVLHTAYDYKFTLLSGALTMGSIVLSYGSSQKVIAGLSVTAAAAIANRDAILDTVRDYTSESPDVEKCVRMDALRTTDYKGTIEETGNGDVICIEGYSGRIFRSSLEAVEDALRTYADRFAEGEYVNFNDLYKLLDIEETHFGFQFGYAPGSDFYDVFEPFKYEVTDIPAEHNHAGKYKGQHIILIDIYTYPMECYMEV